MISRHGQEKVHRHYRQFGQGLLGARHSALTFLELKTWCRNLVHVATAHANLILRQVSLAGDQLGYGQVVVFVVL